MHVPEGPDDPAAVATEGGLQIKCAKTFGDLLLKA